MATKVWAVMVGEYSDAQIIGIIDEQRKKEIESKLSLFDGYFDGPYEINCFDIDPDPGMDFYQVALSKDGSVCDLYGADRYEHRLDRDGKRRAERWLSFTTHNEWRLQVMIYAKSLDCAIKIANDTRVAILAGSKAESGTFPRLNVAMATAIDG